jgi:hypothetical protein
VTKFSKKVVRAVRTLTLYQAVATCRKTLKNANDLKSRLSLIIANDST